jgi:hypothetical protein
MIAKVIHTAYILVHAKTIISQQEKKNINISKEKSTLFGETCFTYYLGRNDQNI